MLFDWSRHLGLLKWERINPGQLAVPTKPGSGVEKRNVDPPFTPGCIIERQIKTNSYCHQGPIAKILVLRVTQALGLTHFIHKSREIFQHQWSSGFTHMMWSIQKYCFTPKSWSDLERRPRSKLKARCSKEDFELRIKPFSDGLLTVSATFESIHLLIVTSGLSLNLTPLPSCPTPRYGALIRIHSLVT